MKRDAWWMDRVPGRMKQAFQRIEAHMTASQIMVTGFALAIFAGGILLSMPFCNADGHWLRFIDALFTACSAVCVTGLVTIVPATQFTLTGKVILLILIQLGGLGIIACTMGTFLILRKQITIRSRVMIQDSYDLHSMTGIVILLRYVIRGTFFVEGCGAVLYAVRFIPQYGLLRGLWYALFHAISAFCNAGIDILGETSLQQYVADPYINVVTILIIVVSGLGFLVWKDLMLAASRLYHREYPLRRVIQKLKLHTKLALVMTVSLLVIGTVGIFCMEYSNPRTLGGMPVGEKWLAAMFQSVTTRTAGFFTIPQDRFLPQSQLLSCILMFIGGSPGGTAGGIKTTTIAILYLTCWSVLKGTEDTECFRRRMPAANVRTAFSVLTVAGTAVLTGTMLILVLEHTGLIPAFYEVVSAVGTVGLTAGLTPVLTTAGKLVIIVLMYMGRLSPVTLALLFASRYKKHGKGRKLPEERIMVG